MPTASLVTSTPSSSPELNIGTKIGIGVAFPLVTGLLVLQVLAVINLWRRYRTTQHVAMKRVKTTVAPLQATQELQAIQHRKELLADPGSHELQTVEHPQEVLSAESGGVDRIRVQLLCT